MDSDRFPYWPRYCEENIWHLCRELSGEVTHPTVAFISNAGRRVAIWHQRAAANPKACVVWDYHVILLGQVEEGWRVYDADSLLPWGVAATRYLERSFQPLPPESAHCAPRFRLLEADLYRRKLASDRRHMRRADGSWLSPPPPGPQIGEGSNLMRFVDTETEFLGRVLGLEELLDFCRSRSWLR
jgi:hypothetical protein